LTVSYAAQYCGGLSAALRRAQDRPALITLTNQLHPLVFTSSMRQFHAPLTIFGRCLPFHTGGHYIMAFRDVRASRPLAQDLRLCPECHRIARNTETADPVAFANAFYLL
jgi:hypothetical protein